VIEMKITHARQMINRGGAVLACRKREAASKIPAEYADRQPAASDPFPRLEPETG
jgi:hypothetical protein